MFCDRYLCVAWATNEQHRIIKFNVYLGTSFNLCYNTTPLSFSLTHTIFTANVIFSMFFFSLPYSFSTHYYTNNTKNTNLLKFTRKPVSRFKLTFTFHKYNIKMPPFFVQPNTHQASICTQNKNQQKTAQV